MQTRITHSIRLLALFVLLMGSPTLLCAQEGEPTTTEVSEAGKDSFFTTLLRTPFALTIGFITAGCIMFTGFMEFWPYLFSGFDYGFPVTKELVDIGWKQVVYEWWWKPGVTWHLIVSILLFSMFSGGNKARKRYKS